MSFTSLGEELTSPTTLALEVIPSASSGVSDILVASVFEPPPKKPLTALPIVLNIVVIVCVLFLTLAAILCKIPSTPAPPLSLVVTVWDLENTAPIIFRSIPNTDEPPLSVVVILWNLE